MSYDTDAEMRLRDILAELERKGMSDLKNLIEDERLAAECSKETGKFVVPSNYFFFIGGSRDEAVEYSKILAWCLYEFGMLETEVFWKSLKASGIAA